MVNSLLFYIGDELKQNGYWDALEVDIGQYKPVVPLEVCTTLLCQISNISRVKELFLVSNGGLYALGVIYKDDNKSYDQYTTNTKIFSPKQLRLIIAGIVLDLIRIKSDNTVSAQFLQSLADTFRPKQDSS